MLCAVYEPIAYTLAAVLGIVILVIIILTMIAYYRMRTPRGPVSVIDEKPPDETLGYPYPGYKPPEPYVLITIIIISRVLQSL